MSTLEDFFQQWLRFVKTPVPHRLNFPHPPCPQLCRYNMQVNRFHLTCLTCPTRIFHYKKRGHENLGRRDPLMIIAHSASGKGFILPKKYEVYWLPIPSNISRVRRQLLKWWLSIGERIAEA